MKSSRVPLHRQSIAFPLQSRLTQLRDARALRDPTTTSEHGRQDARIIRDLAFMSEHGREEVSSLLSSWHRRSATDMARALTGAEPDQISLSHKQRLTEAATRKRPLGMISPNRTEGNPSQPIVKSVSKEVVYSKAFGVILR